MKTNQVSPETRNKANKTQSQPGFSQRYKYMAEIIIKRDSSDLGL